ncbi:MAG: hypothetical protein ACTSYS_04735 [Promethearchaeota archaeon]
MAIYIGNNSYDWGFLGVFHYILFKICFTITFVFAGLLLITILLGLIGISQITKHSNKLSLNDHIAKLKFYLFKDDTIVLNPKHLVLSYYNFQSGNRMIGILLLKITGYFVLIWVSASFTVFFVGLAFPTNFGNVITAYLVLTMLLSMVSLLMFIFPQINIHSTLKKYKRKIIDLLNIKIEEIYDVFIKSYYYKELITTVNKHWKIRKDLNEEIQIINKFLERIKKFSTWCYNFPEILKILLLSLSSLIPIVYKIIVFFIS